MKCQIYIRFNGELGELNHQSQSGGWPFGIDPLSSAGPLYAKKFFFLILYSNTCGGKTKCMVHMSLKLSAEIVKFMTFWLFFFFLKVERVICCTWSCLFRYIYICYCPSKSENIMCMLINNWYEHGKTLRTRRSIHA